jgi:hypothetical protein
MGMETETGIESVGEKRVILVETTGITEISEIAETPEITEIVPGMVETPRTVEIVLTQGYLGTAGIQGKVEKLLEIKSVRKLWNAAANVSVNVSVRRN